MKFIAYFDYLGFKQFIENNDLDYQRRIMGNIYRDIERALGHGNYEIAPSGIAIADISHSSINCINFSDTVVFWTNDQSIESLEEIIKVAHSFNDRNINLYFPARGSLVYGIIEHDSYYKENRGGGKYNINSVYGKGLVEAHDKANKQHWANTVIDKSFIEKMIDMGLDPSTYLKPYAKLYKVPYKDGGNQSEEYVMNLVNGIIDEEAITGLSDFIRVNFAKHNKSIDSPDVQEKINNTIKFLEGYRLKH